MRVSQPCAQSVRRRRLVESLNPLGSLPRKKICDVGLASGGKGFFLFCKTLKDVPAARRNVDAIFFDVGPAIVHGSFHAMYCIAEVVRSLKNAGVALFADRVFMRLQAKDHSSFPRGHRTTIFFDIFAARG